MTANFWWLYSTDVELQVTVMSTRHHQTVISKKDIGFLQMCSDNGTVKL